MICASPNRPFFIVNLLRYLAEKILLLNTTNFRGDYRGKERLGRITKMGDRYIPRLRVTGMTARLRQMPDCDKCPIATNEGDP